MAKPRNSSVFLKLSVWWAVHWIMLDDLFGGVRLGVGPAPEREPFHPARWPGHVFPFACVAAVLGRWRARSPERLPVFGLSADLPDARGRRSPDPSHPRAPVHDVSLPRGADLVIKPRPAVSSSGPPGTVVQTSMNPLFASTDSRTFGALVADGLGTELSYLTPDAQAAAIALEEELTLDALAGVDLRVRLVGAAVSR